MFTAYPTTPPGFPERLGLIVAGLRRTLAAHAAKDRELAVLVLVLWNRLSRLMARVTAIAARHQAGSLRQPRTPSVRRPASAPASRPPPPRDQLPHRRGWLTGWVRECAAHGNYLQLLLEDPETRALIEAVPQLRPLLRPLWRMLRRDPLPEALRSPEPASSKPASRRRKAARRKRRPANPASPTGAWATQRGKAPAVKDPLKHRA